MTKPIKFNVCRYLSFNEKGTVLCILEIAKVEKQHCQRRGRCLFAVDPSTNLNVTRRFFEDLVKDD